jgi:hypothetical protein
MNGSGALGVLHSLAWLLLLSSEYISTAFITSLPVSLVGCAAVGAA